MCFLYGFAGGNYIFHNETDCGYAERIAHEVNNCLVPRVDLTVKDVLKDQLAKKEISKSG